MVYKKSYLAGKAGLEPADNGFKGRRLYRLSTSHWRKIQDSNLCEVLTSTFLAKRDHKPLGQSSKVLLTAKSAIRCKIRNISLSERSNISSI